MSNYNFDKTMIGGHISSDIELKLTPSGKNVVKFAIAVNFKETTKYFDCVAWGTKAEFIAQHFKKGMSISVVGHHDINVYNDKNGMRHKETIVSVEETYFVDNKNEAPFETPAEPKYEELTDKDDLPF